MILLEFRHGVWTGSLECKAHSSIDLGVCTLLRNYSVRSRFPQFGRPATPQRNIDALSSPLLEQLLTNSSATLSSVYYFVQVLRKVYHHHWSQLASLSCVTSLRLQGLGTFVFSQCPRRRSRKFIGWNFLMKNLESKPIQTFLRPLHTCPLSLTSLLKILWGFFTSVSWK